MPDLDWTVLSGPAPEETLIELSIDRVAARRVYSALDRPELHGPPYENGICPACAVMSLIGDALEIGLQTSILTGPVE